MPPSDGGAHRRALVTGSGRGIGAAIAVSLASEYEVIVHANRSTDSAERIVENIVQSGGSAALFAADLSQTDGVRQLIRKSLPVDVLVNNAAFACEVPFQNISEHEFDQMIAVNLKAPFLLSQLVLPHMVERSWGRIINIASIGGQWGGINQIHYATAKAGLIGLTRSLAKTYGSFGVTANAVSPGLIATDMAAAEMARPDGVEKVRNIPLGRVGRAQEVAAAVEFLASDAAGYITGQTINLNGGMLFS